MRVLVTGAAGFVGRRITRALASRGWSVHGTVLARADARGAAGFDGVTIHEADIRNRAAVAAALDAARPEAIVHLAGIAFEPEARRDPVAAYEINALGTAVLLDDVRRRRAAGTLDPRILIIGSGQQYGRHDPASMPLSEGAVQRPLSVYAASKCAQEIIALEAFRTAGVRVVATRSFNHSGPGQAATFLLPALARRVLDTRTSGARSIPIGNTAPIRDWLHVDDVVEAYLGLLERGEPGEAYNVSRGEGISVGDLAERLIARAGMTLTLDRDPALQRAVDVPVLVGDSSKLRAATGWAPRHTIDDLLDELLRAQTH